MVAPYATITTTAAEPRHRDLHTGYQRGGSLHRSLRKIIKTRGSFPNDEAAFKLLFLALRNAGVRWRRPIEWTAAMGQFAILFSDRFSASAR
jgi:transposase-like protein